MMAVTSHLKEGFHSTDQHKQEGESQATPGTGWAAGWPEEAGTATRCEHSFDG